MSLITREMQIKATMHCHITPVRMVSSINQQTTSLGENVKESEPLCTVGRTVNLHSHYEKQSGSSSKKLKI